MMCPDSGEKLSVILLRNGFWRAKETSERVEQEITSIPLRDYVNASLMKQKKRAGK